MKLTLDSWIQIATSVAVLVGLGLVVVEIRQTHRLSRAELGAMSYDATTGRMLANVGESFAIAMSKSCVAPEELTDSELTELRYWYSAGFAHSNRQRMMKLIGGFEYRWEDAAEYEFSQTLSTQPGRAWFETYKEDLRGVSPEIVEVGEKVARMHSRQDCEDLAKEYFNKARSAVGADTTAREG